MRVTRNLACLLLMLGLMLMHPLAAMAANTTNSTNTSQACTNFEENKRIAFGTTGTTSGSTTASATGGIMSEIYGYIKDVVGDATQKLFSAFTSNSTYTEAVRAAMVLMVIIYGVGFTIGVVQASFGEVLIRLVKIGLIATLISSSGWTFFSEYVVAFFADGTDNLIKGVMAIGTGVTAPADATPFWQLDNLTKFILTPDTIIAVMSSVMAGGPFGMAMGGMMVFALWSFFQLLLKTLQNYAICYVARALLLGVAPIFFVFLLFKRTSNLFIGWINVLLNLSLQPILLFTFLSFFIVLIQSASTEMLNTDFCWTEFKSVEGTENKPAFFRALDKTTKSPIVGDMTWKGPLECIISGRSDCPEFPINIIDILSFLILVYLAQRFASVIERICTELSSALVNLDAGGKMDQFMQGQNNKGLFGGSPNKPTSGTPKKGKQ